MIPRPKPLSLRAGIAVERDRLRESNPCYDCLRAIIHCPLNGFRGNILVDLRTSDNITAEVNACRDTGLRDLKQQCLKRLSLCWEKEAKRLGSRPGWAAMPLRIGWMVGNRLSE
jgi:hypothetical protein